ncbi:BspA family leucine-rich repeat surface protein [Companilactobacillus nodensis]|nr:BspA family leucine-rich repeat surface protein [Companilactobacillus nodensis]
MRFQQLKHNPNTIVRKKLYKSGKNWVVMSSLAFASGLVFLGASTTNVSADPVDDTTDTQSNTEQVVEQPAEKTDPKVVPQDTKDTGNDGVQANADTPQTPQKDEIEPVDNQSESLDQTGQKQNVEPAETNTNIAEGQLDTDDNTGSKWYIDSDKTLHIGAGTVSSVKASPSNKNPWENQVDNISKVSFDDKCTGGDSLENLFSGLSNLVEVDNIGNLDVSKTSKMTNMFENTNIENLDISSWKIKPGADLSGMFKNHKSLNKVNLDGMVFVDNDLTGMFENCNNLSSVTMNGTSFSGAMNYSVMFQYDYNLKYLDLRGFDMTNPKSKFDGMLALDFLEKVWIGSKTVLCNDGQGTSAELNYNDGSSGGDNFTVFKGWKGTDGVIHYGSDQPEYLDHLYDSVEAAATNGDTYWEAVPIAKVKYIVNYYDASDDSQKTLFTTTGSNYEGENIPLTEETTFLGFMPVDKDQLGSIDLAAVKSESDLVQTFEIPIVRTAISTANLVYTENGGTKREIPIRGGYDFVSDLSKFEDALFPKGTINLDKTTFDIFTTLKGQEYPIMSGKFTDPADDNETIASYLGLKEGCSSKEFASALGKFITELGSNYYSETVNLNIVYNESMSSNTGTHHHSHGSSSPATNKGITIKQTQDVATMTKTVNAYNKLGNVVTNRALAANTGWISDEKYTLNDESYYRVATDEYVKTSDVYVYVPQRNIVRVHDDQIGYLVNAEGNKVTNRALQSSTDWITDRYTMINGEKYYRVATNEFVNESYVSLV